MTEQVRRVAYYYVEVPDEAGQGTKILSALKEAGVNLLAFSGFPLGGGRSQLDFLPEDPEAFLRVMREQDFELSDKKEAFLVEGDDRVGALAEVVAMLASQGISIRSGQSISTGDRRWGMILWVSPENYQRARKALGV